MSAYHVDFPERTIAQVITVMKSYCRVTNKVPHLVAIVEGTMLEHDAWRKVANDYLIAKAQNRNVDFSGKPATKGEDDGSTSDYFAELSSSDGD